MTFDILTQILTPSSHPFYGLVSFFCNTQNFHSFPGSSRKEPEHHPLPIAGPPPCDPQSFADILRGEMDICEVLHFIIESTSSQEVLHFGEPNFSSCNFYSLDIVLSWKQNKSNLLWRQTDLLLNPGSISYLPWTSYFSSLRLENGDKNI